MRVGRRGGEGRREKGGEERREGKGGGRTGDGALARGVAKGEGHDVRNRPEELVARGLVDARQVRREPRRHLARPDRPRCRVPRRMS